MAKVTCRHLETTLPAEPPPICVDGYVYIYTLSVAYCLPLAKDKTGILSADEKTRAARYHYDRDRRRFEVSRIALRAILAAFLNIKPEEIVFALGENKKPFVAGSDLQYNMTHSGDMVLIAVSKADVGIDVEFIDREFESTDVLHACFSPVVQDFINAGTDPQATFYKFWTRKEALQKATGRGLDDDIVNVPCLDGTYVMNGKTDFVVGSFMLADDYTASVASSGTPKCWFVDGNTWLARHLK